jgi:formylglycine-generating enzyme required for sulfatase activity
MIVDAEQALTAGPSARIFISYSRKDMPFADRLEAALKARGFETLIDRTEIYAFEDWWKRIQALIGRADTIVFVLSPDAVASDVALKEVAHGAMLNKRFAPIVCRQVEIGAVPEAVRRLNFIFFDDPAHFEASADQLAQALHTDIGWIRQHTDYGEAARRWSAAGRPGGLLLRSPALDVAEHWITSRPHGAPAPSEETQAFVAESRQGARSARRLRRLVQIVIYTLLLGIIGGLIGWINQSYLEEQIHWYATVRPYMLREFRPHVLAVQAEQALRPNDTFRECAKDCPEMVVLPAGSFSMGSSSISTSMPQHQVTIKVPFAVAKFELTFAEWDACTAVGACPQAADSGKGRGSKPVINVSWNDAEKYAAWLSLMTGKSYRLLSEAEYEYAARGGTQTAYYWGDQIGTNNANCADCGSAWANKETAPVGKFAPNAFGLYDMGGNVWEWVADCYHGNYDHAPIDGSAWMTGVAGCPNGGGQHVIRGGGYQAPSRTVRSDFRYFGTEIDRWDDRGFRVGRTFAPP